VRSGANVGATVANVALIQPPGTYHDGPVYVRVDRVKAEGARPKWGCEREIDVWELREDPVYDYFEIENSHSAFVYCRWLVEAGATEKALSVVRHRRPRRNISQPLQ